MLRFVLSLTAIIAFCLVAGVDTRALADGKPVIEVVTLKLKPGTTPAEFAAIDKAVETEHVSKQPGFISRESAAGKDGTWLVVIHWRSAADADASMASFAQAAGAAAFMDNIDASSMVMNRYEAS